MYKYETNHNEGESGIPINTVEELVIVFDGHVVTIIEDNHKFTCKDRTGVVEYATVVPSKTWSENIWEVSEVVPLCAQAITLVNQGFEVEVDKSKKEINYRYNRNWCLPFTLTSRLEWTAPTAGVQLPLNWCLKNRQRNVYKNSHQSRIISDINVQISILFQFGSISYEQHVYNREQFVSMCNTKYHLYVNHGGDRILGGRITESNKSKGSVTPHGNGSVKPGTPEQGPNQGSHQQGLGRGSRWDS